MFLFKINEPFSVKPLVKDFSKIPLLIPIHFRKRKSLFSKEIIFQFKISTQIKELCALLQQYLQQLQLHCFLSLSQLIPFLLCNRSFCQEQHLKCKTHNFQIHALPFKIKYIVILRFLIKNIAVQIGKLKRRLKGGKDAIKTTAYGFFIQGPCNLFASDRGIPTTLRYDQSDIKEFQYINWFHNHQFTCARPMEMSTHVIKQNEIPN